jgi:neutral ceramidase
MSERQVKGLVRWISMAAIWVGLGSFAAGDVVEQGAKDSLPSGLLAGVARADITPAVGIPHMNWGSATHIEADGVDPVGMYVTALVLSDGKQKFAMVDMDGGLGGGAEVIDRASAKTGIPAAHIRLGSSHTHAGPSLSGGTGPAGADLTPYRPMMEAHRATVADKVVGAIMEADSKLQPVHMYGGRGTGTININRRFRGANGGPPAVGLNPDGFVDRELIVFRIDDAQGHPYAVLANFQCHGTVLAYENKKISPDWIGMTRKVIEEALPGATALFFQGAAGNQGPIEGFTGDLSVAHRLGAILGHQAAAVALQIETVKREPKFEGYVESRAYQAKQHWRVSGPRDATLKFATKVITVPRREYEPDEIENMAAQVADAQKSVDSFREGDQSREAYQARARLRRLSGLLSRWKQPPSGEPVTVQLQILRIGDLAIVAMPGEPFAEIGAAIKEASPFAYTMFCGYSSGVGGGYMPIESEYQHRGYEIEGTRYGRGAAAEVIRAATAMYEEVR